MNADMDENRNVVRIGMGIAAALLLAGGGWWWWQGRSKPAEAAVEAPADETPAEVALVEPDTIQHPLEPTTGAAPPPGTPMPTPDEAALAALNELFGSGIGEWLVTDQLARRLVATIDTLGRDASVEKIRPLRTPETAFAVDRRDEDTTAGTERIAIAPANFARYDAVIDMISATDAATAAATYKRIYPQLQAAYEDLGYPGRYFNDRVVAVIDHLLLTPEPEGPLLLEQPKVLYRFADADLESRSPGQKLLLRIGVEHARTVKQKLREFRAQIATPAPAP